MREAGIHLRAVGCELSPGVLEGHCSRTGGEDCFVLQGFLDNAPESQNQGCLPVFCIEACEEAKDLPQRAA